MLQGKKASISEGQELKITKKYGTTGFMYTEYPHKRFWPQDSSQTLFQKALCERFSTSEDIPTMLYIHIPYCQQLCWFCTCHISITQDYAKVQAYLKHLYREIDCLRQFFEHHELRPHIQEIHLGGGSPTFVEEPEFEELIEKLRSIADVDHLDEFAIEIDPRRVDEKRMEFYAEKGINRISFGIQDFDIRVQEAV
ncbi:MAG: radical SAM protein, partial [Acidobacteriota bacterium]